MKIATVIKGKKNLLWAITIITTAEAITTTTTTTTTKYT